MGNWLAESVGSIAGWLGSGVSSFFDWLLGGIITVVTMIVDAAGGFWDVLEAIWDFALSFMHSLLGLVGVFFPFIPEPVMSVLSLGFLAILIAGIVRKVRKE